MGGDDVGPQEVKDAQPVEPLPRAAAVLAQTVVHLLLRLAHVYVHREPQLLACFGRTSQPFLADGVD